MATALRPVAHDARLSLVEHLDELRTRLIICVAAFAACFALCAWQNGILLDVINRPLEKTAFKAGDSSKDPFEQTATLQQQQKRVAQGTAEALTALRGGVDDARTRALLDRIARLNRDLAAAVPPRQARKPVTLGVGEPFTATLTIAAWAALLLAMPVILFQLYAFVLPAFAPRERRVALPLMLLVPVLFIAGVVFSYFVVLPNAINFLQNFNDDAYDILIQAKDYQRFVVMALAVLGLLFQIPVGILAVTRLGIVTPRQLRKNRRYAILLCAVLAMLLPGTDPVTMVLSMAPLVVLYEGSIVLAALLDRRSSRAAELEDTDWAALDAADEDEDDEELVDATHPDKERI